MIQLWIPEDKGNPIQEKLLSGKESKDYNLWVYSNMRINPAIPDSDFEMTLPAGVKVIKPN
jgi:outer membrane lipoprotein-sorting protein